MGVGGEEGSLAANGREDLVSKGITHSQWDPGGADPAHSIQESQVFKMDGRECGRRKGARGRERDRQGGGRSGRRAPASWPRLARRGAAAGAEPARERGWRGARGREGERGQGARPRGRGGQRKSPGRRRWQAEEHNEEQCVGIGSSQKGNATGFRVFLFGRGEGTVWALFSPLLSPPLVGISSFFPFRNHR